MIDEKDPRRESVEADVSDDDIIIDLTDEVDVSPEDENHILNLTEDMADDAAESAEASEALDDESEEDLPGLDDVDPINSSPGGDAMKLAFSAADDDKDRAADRPIAAATDEWPKAASESARKPEGDFDPESSPDDDVLIIDNAPEMEIDLPSRAGSGSPAESRGPQDAFDLEEEIELEYESDEGEENELDLDLERSDDSRDFVDMVLESSQTPDPSDDDYEPTQYLELDTEELDDIVLPEEDLEDEPEADATPDDIGELTDSDELPDIEAFSDLDFEDINDISDEDESRTPESDELPDSDDLLAGIGSGAGPVEEIETQPSDKSATLGLEEIENFPGLIDPDENDQEILSLTDDETHLFEEETGSLDLEGGLEPELDDEVIPLDGFKGMPDDPEEEIIEITEFDQHFPVEGETLLKQTGILDSSASEENDFLELIDVEEDILSEDQEVVEFGDPQTAGADEFDSRLETAEMDAADPAPTGAESIFSDDVEDRVLEAGTSDPGPATSLEEEEEEGFLGKEVSGFLEEDSEPDAGSAEDDAEISPPAEAIFPESENFDFNVDPGSIAQQVDQLDTFLTEDQAAEPGKALFPSDYPEAEDTAEPEMDEVFSDRDGEVSAAGTADPADTVAAPEESPSDKTGAEGAPAGGDSKEFPPVPPDQIDAAIERAINEKFAGKIEEIIYEVIEKAVAKEIDRLKGALLGDDEPE